MSVMKLKRLGELVIKRGYLQPLCHAGWNDVTDRRMVLFGGEERESDPRMCFSWGVLHVHMRSSTYWTFVSSQTHLLKPVVTGLEGGAFRKRLGHEGGALVNKISALY